MRVVRAREALIKNLEMEKSCFKKKGINHFKFCLLLQIKLLLNIY